MIVSEVCPVEGCEKAGISWCPYPNDEPEWHEWMKAQFQHKHDEGEHDTSD